MPRIQMEFGWANSPSCCFSSRDSSIYKPVYSAPMSCFLGAIDSCRGSPRTCDVPTTCDVINCLLAVGKKTNVIYGLFYVPHARFPYISCHA